MPPLYRDAIAWLVILTLIAIVCGALATCLGTDAVLGTMTRAFIFLFIWLTPSRHRKYLDERDTQINTYADRVAGNVVLLGLVLIPESISSVYHHQGHSTISIDVLCNLTGIYLGLAMLARAVAIIYQYRRQGVGKEE